MSSFSFFLKKMIQDKEMWENVPRARSDQST
jgi:hypothetical protein